MDRYPVFPQHSLDPANVTSSRSTCSSTLLEYTTSNEFSLNGLSVVVERGNTGGRSAVERQDRYVTTQPDFI